MKKHHEWTSYIRKRLRTHFIYIDELSERDKRQWEEIIYYTARFIGNTQGFFDDPKQAMKDIVDNFAKAYKESFDA